MRFKGLLYKISGALLIIGFLLSIYGIHVRGKTIFTEPKGRFWIEGQDIVPPRGKRVTWGLAVTPEQMPDYWRLHVIFRSNTSVWVRAFWESPDKIMYERFGNSFDEVLYIKLMNENNRKWTWYIDNSGEYTALIENFTVIYEGVIKPREIQGSYMIYTGILFVSGGVFILILLKAKKGP